MVVVYVLLRALLLTLATASMVPKNCPDSCGTLNISYPFGIGEGCYKDSSFEITCNRSSNPPRPFLTNVYVEDTGRPMVAEVRNISLRSSVVQIWSPFPSIPEDRIVSIPYAFFNGRGSGPYAFSTGDNQRMNISFEVRPHNESLDSLFFGWCPTVCSSASNPSNRPGVWDGMNNCYRSIRTRLEMLSGNFSASDGICNSVFWADRRRLPKTRYNFGSKSSVYYFPLSLEWAIGNRTCEAEAESGSSRPCGNNSNCRNSRNGVGYLCECNEGYEGNPYLPEGCKAINACADRDTSPCISIEYCEFSEGRYRCKCPPGQTGDGSKNGSGCSSRGRDSPVLRVTLGCALGLIFMLLACSFLYWGQKKRKMIKLREKFFQQNGGFLLQQKLASHPSSSGSANIFTTEELKTATDNYSDSRILGKGGHGTVYKGILPDKRIVAIKKSKIVDQTQIEQFINEVVILSQINHKNVVKLLGCCLETHVPMLVYEFVTNGTLFDHLHGGTGATASISWENRLRIAAETAGALAYLHSTASVPIIHRDIKSTNILLDDNYTAKVSDFGASRVIPLDHDQLTTLVQGTLGYLDPEYFLTSHLSEKSDVYSFGVVLVELLTGERPLRMERAENERNLAMHFVSCVKENRVVEILEERVASEGRIEEVAAVAEVAKRCLKSKGEQRPTMKEVAAELEALQKAVIHPWEAQSNQEESEILLSEIPDLDSASSGAINSLNDAVLQINFQG